MKLISRPRRKLLVHGQLHWLSGTNQLPQIATACGSWQIFTPPKATFLQVSSSPNLLRIQSTIICICPVMDSTEAPQSYITAHPIFLNPIEHRIAVWPLDDWTDITDPKERRKLQNRFNQRARRRRQRTLQAQSYSLERPAEPQTAYSPTNLNELKSINGLQILGPDFGPSICTIRRLEMLIYAEYAARSPRTELLLSLTQLNFLRALITNIDVLHLSPAQMHDEALSPFNLAGPRSPEYQDSSLPSALQPTALQRTIPHHPWLDLLPIPEMRDRLILAGESLDDVQLCHDLCGYRNSGTGQTGMLVWKDPWDPVGWEVTETFMRTWGWAVQGSWGLFQSTNYWRMKRGEKPLFRLPPEAEIST